MPNACIPIVCFCFLLSLGITVIITTYDLPWKNAGPKDPTLLVGSHAYGHKKRVKHACLPEHGTCTPLSLCTEGTVRTDVQTATAVAGHGDFVCPHMYDVCCQPEARKVHQFLEDFGELAHSNDGADDRMLMGDQMRRYRRSPVGKLVRMDGAP